MRLPVLAALPLIAVLAFAAQPAAAAKKLELTGNQVEAESDRPRACFEFSHPLQQRSAARYRDYLRFDPEFPAEFSVRGKRLCVDGLAHGASYRVAVLAGLPGAGERITAKTERFEVVVPDRAPSLAFRGGAHILPRKGQRELALESVNVKAARLKVLRVNDRNLMQQINAGRIGELLSGYDAGQIERLDGELVWQGGIEIDSERNRRMTTAVPIDEILGRPKPGVYAVLAVTGKPADEDEERATQWLIVSDVGVTTYLGQDGLHVFLRSLEDAMPLVGAEVRLVARNNAELGRARTDADGKASFAAGLTRGAGGARPGAVMVFADGGDFNFLDLTRPGFDLTDRGVGGRAAPGPVDAFLYTDRGVYRPGATVHLTALVRDDKAAALPDLPVILRIFRPDGTEDRRFTLKDGKAGGHHLALPLGSGARTGQWTVRAYADPKAAAIGRAAFLVEDFVPERMEVALVAAAPRLEPGVDNAVALAARFLYGAPAAGLTVDGELVLRQDLNPYPQHKGYKFGLVQEEWRARRQALAPAKTDAEGRATLAVGLDEAPATTRPLRAVLRASVSEPGGRAVTRSVSLPVRSRPLAIGIRPLNGDAAVEQGQPGLFDVAAVGPDGKMLARDGLAYELYREEHRYHWFRRDSRWDYKVLIDDEMAKSGTVAPRAAKPARLAFKLGWGRYRLEIHDSRTGAATSHRFRVGWFAAAHAADVPDKLEISLDRTAYKAGETARVHIRPPFAGRALLVVAGSRVYETRNIAVPKAGLTIELPVKADWDAGAYVTATVFRPAGEGSRYGPARAVGVAWLKRDYGARTLTVDIEAPAKMLPRRKLGVRLQVRGMAPGRAAYVTLAAVDEGILQLTGFESPAPDRHFFGKRRLAVELRDDYGRLIESVEGRPGRLRQGGDADAAARHLGGLDASSIKTVALFSGLVRIGGDGRARIPLDIPDFNGRLRLMAVAYDGAKVGRGEAEMIVRDALVSQVTLPRFLAPGDKGRMTVSLHNVDGPAGKYGIRLESSGPVAVAGEAATRLRLRPDARESLAFTLEGATVGVAEVRLAIEGPRGLKLTRRWDLTVRPAQPAVTRRVVEQIEPGESVAFTGDLLTEFVPGTGEAQITLSTQPDLGVANLLASLSRYPYGCVEQTTSRALPLLYVSEVAEAIGLAENDKLLKSRVQKAIRRVLSMQRSDGAFGLWSSQDKREEWLSAYVMDFLTQARAKGHLVPDFAYQRGLGWLARSVASLEFTRGDLPARAYAFYVLALAKQARLSDLRYVNDTYLDQVPTPLGRAQIAAALALAGDQQRAVAAFSRAPRIRRRTSLFGQFWRAYWDYGSPMRDIAATVRLVSTAGIHREALPDLVTLMNDAREQEAYLSTQEKAWLLLAAAALQSEAPMQLAVDGQEVAQRTRPLHLRAAQAALAAGLEVANLGDDAIWQTVSISGVPDQEMRPDRNGFAISRRFYTLDGKRADLSKLRQSDVLVALISGEATGDLDHQALVVDLLPAGFEIENDRLAGGRAQDEMGWLPNLTEPRHRELRDDRYVAAIDLRRNKGDFVLAYQVRAVTPGSFRLPAVHVEDMYKPKYFARHQMGRVTILPRE